jgi:hypothetical protein
LTERVKIDLFQNSVALVGAPGDKLLFEDDFQFVERRLGKIAGFGIGEVRRYSGDNRDPGIRLWLVGR